MEMHHLQPYHLDVLKEISNIGAAHAATALSSLVKERIEMSVPNVKLVPLNDLPCQFGGVETKVAAIFLRIEGDAPGSLYFITGTEDAEKLIRTLTGNDLFQLDEPPYDDLGMSAFQEVGNILAGSYLSSLSDFTKLALQPTVPGVSIDMVGAVLSFGLMPLLQVGDYAIVIDTEIMEVEGERNRISGQFLFLPDPDSFEVIFHALGVGTNE